MKTNCRNGQGGGDSSDNVSDAGQLGEKKENDYAFYRLQ